MSTDTPIAKRLLEQEDISSDGYAIVCDLERELAALREDKARLVDAITEAIELRAKTREWRTDHPTTTGKPERWVRDVFCAKWRAAIDAARKEVRP